MVKIVTVKCVCAQNNIIMVKGHHTHTLTSLLVSPSVVQRTQRRRSVVGMAVGVVSHSIGISLVAPDDQ